MTQNPPFDDNLPRYTATPFVGKTSIDFEKMRDQLIGQMQNMSQKEIENIADIIVGLVKELKEVK